jgi:hypothetical protein
MSKRTQQEINDIGFGALVRALGKEDAFRFIRQFSAQPRVAGTTSDEDDTLPSMTPDEAHERIMDMHDQPDQASML